jgi:hypothetical protein
MAASVYRARSRLAPFVIDLTGEAAGDKKNYQSNDWDEKWAGEFTVCIHPTMERYAAIADGLGSRVG